MTVKFLFSLALFYFDSEEAVCWGRRVPVYGEASSERFLSKTLSVRSRGYSLHPFVRAFLF